MVAVQVGLRTMTSTTGFTLSRFSSSQPASAVSSVVGMVQRLDVDEQLTLFWRLYTELSCLVTPVVPSATRLQQAEGLLSHFRRMSADEQLQALRELVARVNTPVACAYGTLSANTKLACWYQLASWMAVGQMVPITGELSEFGKTILAEIERLEVSQQAAVLRNLVMNMGVDPLAR